MTTATIIVGKIKSERDFPGHFGSGDRFDVFMDPTPSLFAGAAPDIGTSRVARSAF